MSGLFDVTLNDSYQGEVIARTPEDAIDTSIQGQHNIGTDISCIKTAKVRNSITGETILFTVEIDRNRIAHYYRED